MSDESLVIGMTRSAGGAATVHVSGEIDAATVRQLSAQLLDALRGATSLEVDVAGVEFIDSSGIRCFLQAKLEADRAGIELQIVGLRPHPRRILHIAGVERFLGCEAEEPTTEQGPMPAVAQMPAWSDGGNPPLAIA
jgi:anti-sigma B factor antagonist